MRLTPLQRLRCTAEFEAARNGLRVEAGPFLVQVLPQEGSRLKRLGVIASRRVGGAVQRNRCKRLLRELFRRNQILFPEGSYTVLIARKRLVEMDYAEAEPIFRKGVTRLLRNLEGGPHAPQA